MPCSCSTTDVSRDHVCTTVPQFMADLHTSLLIEVWVELIAAATVDGRGMMGDLLVAFARIGCPQFVEAFKVVLMEEVSGEADDSSLEIKVAFMRRKQVAATVGRDLFGKPQRVTDMVIYCNPARCRRA